MYLSVETWVEAIFYIHSRYICSCLSRLLLSIDHFLWGGHNILHLFFCSFIFLCCPSFSSSCSNTLKAVFNLQMSKTPKPVHTRFNAKSLIVHSMNNIQAPDTLFWSVFVTDSVVGAVRAPGRADLSSQTSALCLFLCNRTRNRENVSWPLNRDPNHIYIYIVCTYKYV